MAAQTQVIDFTHYRRAREARLTAQHPPAAAAAGYAVVWVSTLWFQTVALPAVLQAQHNSRGGDGQQQD